MKNSLSNVQDRRNQIISSLEEHDTLSVRDLADEFTVSEVTVRRDLKALTDMGSVEWKNGMATYKDNQAQMNDVATVNNNLEQIKMRIATAVTGFIEESTTLFVNSSSLCWRAINQLSSERLTIITNNVHATECVHHPQTMILLTGGEIRYPKESLVGGVATQLISSMQSDYTLIGTDGVSLKGGLTTQNIYESQVNAAMVKHTRGKVICLADYRKIGVTSNYPVASIDKVDILITDSYANEKVLKSLRNKGIQVIQVQPND